MAKQKMTPSEALVETLVAEGVEHVFGIVGSAYMDALDLFPAAGIFEQGGPTIGRRLLLTRLKPIGDAGSHDQTAKNAAQQGVGAQPIGPVVLIVTLTDRVEPRDICQLVLG